MRFRQLDLNLLYALSTLIEERSVSRAAERLHVSQPTMSAALARLREYFQDPILVQQGRAMVPSTMALEFRQMLKDILTNVNAMIAASHGFDPASSDHTFCISTSDYFALTLLPGLIKSIHAQAPGLKFEIITTQDGFSRSGEKNEVDIVLIPADFTIAGHPSKILYHETYVVLGCAANPLVGKPMTEDEFYASAHIAVQPRHPDRDYSIGETFLRSRGRPHTVEITTSSFFCAPELIIGSERLLMLPRRLAEYFCAHHPVRFVELPFAFKGFEALVQFHSSRSSDPRIAWLIEQIENQIGSDQRHRKA